MTPETAIAQMLAKLAVSGPDGWNVAPDTVWRVQAPQSRDRFREQARWFIDNLPADVARNLAVAKTRSTVGDLIVPNDADVQAVRDCDGDTWRRAVGDDQHGPGDQIYPWVTEGGWRTTIGMLHYAPLTVTAVTGQPAEAGKS